MPSLKAKLDSFIDNLQPHIIGFDNAKTTTHIAKIIAKNRKIDTNSPYSLEFRSIKTTVNRWLKELNETKRIKRKSAPSDAPIQSFIYWIEVKK